MIHTFKGFGIVNKAEIDVFLEQASYPHSSEGRHTATILTEKAEEPEIKLPPSAGSWKKQESSRKNIYFCFIDYAKAFDSVDHNKLWEILKEIGISLHFTCLEKSVFRTRSKS